MKHRPSVAVCSGWLALLCLMPLAAGAGREKASWRTEFIDLTVELDPAGGFLKGDALIRLRRQTATAGDILLELNHELSVASIDDGSGRPLPFDREGRRIAVHWRAPGPHGASRSIRMRFQGSFHERVPELDYRNAWIGVPVSHAFGTSLWYPQAPAPARRCRGRISYLVPENWVVASVGRRTATEALPGAKRIVFAVDSPARFSFAAGPFDHEQRSIDGLEMGIFLLGGGPKKTAFYLENCARILAFFKDYYGFFPCESFSLVELPADLLGKTGGGSFDGLTFYPPSVLPGDFFLVPVFAHEIGHCWWGSCVRGVEGPAINEGLAQMSMELYVEHTLGEKAFRRLLKDGALELGVAHSARSYFWELQSPRSEADSPLSLLLRGKDLPLGVPAEGESNTLHMLANSKGVFVYAMLRDLIGPEAFRGGLRRALRRTAGGTITLDNLRACFERQGRRRLKWFFAQWFLRAGAPEFSLSFATKARGRNWRVTGRVTQAGKPYRVRVEIAFAADGKRQVRAMDVSGEESRFAFILPFRPQAAELDPDYKILRWADEFKK